MSASKPNRRQRWLCIVLGCALAVWGIDLWTGQGARRFAQARPGETPRPPVHESDWASLDALVNRLASNASGTAAVSSELSAQDERDLFVPGADFAQAVLVARVLKPPDAVTTPASDPHSEFAETHRLRGVVLGHRPLALVNDRVLTLHSLLDGFRLVTIARDHVVFLDPQRRQPLVLKLSGPENKEPAAAIP